MMFIYGTKVQLPCSFPICHAHTHGSAHLQFAASLDLLLPAELTPSQARSSLPPSHPLLQSSRPVATAMALHTSSTAPHLGFASAGSKPKAQITSMEPMNSARKASHANAAVTNNNGSTVAVAAKAAAAATAATAAAAATAAEAATAATAAAHSTDDVGLASQSSKGSSHMSIAAAASGVVTRLMKASTDMSGASHQASDDSDAEQTQLSQSEEADATHLGEAREQAGSGLPVNGITALKTLRAGDTSTDQVKSSGHSSARQACEDVSDVVMADGSTAVDDVITEEAEAAGPAAVSVTGASHEAQNRLVSYWLCLSYLSLSAGRWSESWTPDRPCQKKRHRKSTRLAVPCILQTQVLVIYLGDMRWKWLPLEGLLPFQKHRQEKVAEADSLLAAKRLTKPILFHKALKVTNSVSCG